MSTKVISVLSGLEFFTQRSVFQQRLRSAWKELHDLQKDESIKDVSIPELQQKEIINCIENISTADRLLVDYRIGIMGEVAEGKSTLLNSIIESKLFITKLACTEIRYAPETYTIRLFFPVNADSERDFNYFYSKKQQESSDRSYETEADDIHLEIVEARLNALYSNLDDVDTFDALKPRSAARMQLIGLSPIVFTGLDIAALAKDFQDHLKEKEQDYEHLLQLITIEGPFEQLPAGVVLVDTPGLGDSDFVRSARALEMMESFDCIWYTTTAANSFSRTTSQEFWCKFRKFTDKGIHVIATKADNEDQRNENVKQSFGKNMRIALYRDFLSLTDNKDVLKVMRTNDKLIKLMDEKYMEKKKDLDLIATNSIPVLLTSVNPDNLSFSYGKDALISFLKSKSSAKIQALMQQQCLFQNIVKNETCRVENCSKQLDELWETIKTTHFIAPMTKGLRECSTTTISRLADTFSGELHLKTVKGIRNLIQKGTIATNTINEDRRNEISKFTLSDEIADAMLSKESVGVGGVWENFLQKLKSLVIHMTTFYPHQASLYSNLIDEIKEIGIPLFQKRSLRDYIYLAITASDLNSIAQPTAQQLRGKLFVKYIMPLFEQTQEAIFEQIENVLKKILSSLTSKMQNILQQLSLTTTVVPACNNINASPSLRIPLPPISYTCSKTFDLMNQPVTARGCKCESTFQLSSLPKYLRHGGKCPSCRNKLTQLQPRPDLEIAISIWKQLFQPSKRNELNLNNNVVADPAVFTPTKKLMNENNNEEDIDHEEPMFAATSFSSYKNSGDNDETPSLVSVDDCSSPADISHSFSDQLPDEEYMEMVVVEKANVVNEPLTLPPKLNICIKEEGNDTCLKKKRSIEKANEVNEPLISPSKLNIYIKEEEDDTCLRKKRSIEETTQNVDEEEQSKRARTKKYVFHNDTIRKAIPYYFSSNHRDKAIIMYGEIGTWDTSQVTDMSELFKDRFHFNEDISAWDVSNVTNMCHMFHHAQSFNQPLNSWDVSKITDMSCMFYNAMSFNQPLEKWDVSKVTKMNEIFYNAKAFNQPLTSWNVSNSTDISRALLKAMSFDMINNAPDGWDPKIVFNSPLQYSPREINKTSLVVASVSTIKPALQKYFEADNKTIRDAVSLYCKDKVRAIIRYGEIDTWDTRNVTDMKGLFKDSAEFNENINNWDVSNVKNMSEMFCDAKRFNQPLNSWNLVPVTDTRKMFQGASSFDYSLNSPKLSIIKATITKVFRANNKTIREAVALYYGNTIEGIMEYGPINTWDTTDVTDMKELFKDRTLFDEDISAWNVCNVTNMTKMFYNAKSFNQPLNSWDVSKITDMSCMFYNAMSFNQPLEKWDVSKVIEMSEIFHNAKAFNQPLTSWNIITPTASVVKSGASEYFEVDNKTMRDDVPLYCKDKKRVGFYGEDVSFASNSKDFKFVDLDYSLNSARKLNVTKTKAFIATDETIREAVKLYCSNTIEGIKEYGAIHTWDTTFVTDMRELFKDRTRFNEDISAWNVCNVTNMTKMFYNAKSFNKPLNSWKVSNVKYMSCMFHEAKSFNQPLNDWDVRKVTNMGGMFHCASKFNQPLSNWKVCKVNNMGGMFQFASSFNQSLRNWKPKNLQMCDNMFKGASSFDLRMNSWG